MESSPQSQTELNKAAAVLASKLERQGQGSNSGNRPVSAGESNIGSRVASLRDEVAKLAAAIDHTLLRPDSVAQAIETLCGEARQMSIGAVCVNPAWVPLARGKLQGSPVQIATVCGFPLGATLPAAKRDEAAASIAAGANEVDMVMNVGSMKSGELAQVEDDIAAVVEVCRVAQVPVKVIIENCYLTREEKVRACEIAQRAGAAFVKTSTGFGPSGATEEDVQLMRQVVGPSMGVKAAGGIRTLADALRMVQAGATRVGTSRGHAIVTEAMHLMNAEPVT